MAGWRFAHSEEEDATPVFAARPVLLDHGVLLVDAAATGLGVAQVFDFMVREQLLRGDLVEVMTERSVAGPPMHALCVPGRQHVPKIRAFMDFAVEVFGAAREGDGAQPRAGSGARLT